MAVRANSHFRLTSLGLPACAVQRNFWGAGKRLGDPMFAELRPMPLARVASLSPVLSLRCSNTSGNPARARGAPDSRLERAASPANALAVRDDDRRRTRGKANFASPLLRDLWTGATAFS